MTFPANAVTVSGVCTIGRFDISHGVDWNDGVQLFGWKFSGNTPYRDKLDLTNTRQSLIIRPSYENSWTIKALDTLTGEIIVSNPTSGMVQFFTSYGLVNQWPLGEWTFVWDILMNGAWSRIAKGPFVIHPGRNPT